MYAIRLFLVLTVVIAAPLFLPGHVEQRIAQSGGGNIAIKWPQGATITYLVNNQTGPGLPNVATGSTPSTAVNSAFATIAAASGLNLVNGGTTATTNVGADGVNLVTFANTPQNLAVVGGATAVAVVSFNTATGNIVEADIVFSPNSNFSTTGSAADQDVESVATHEVGHFVGQAHTPHLHATMFPFNLAGRTNLRSLSEDDLAGLRTLYPGSTGSLFGTVIGQVERTPTQPVFGAHVVLQDAITGQAVTGGVTFVDGSFRIEGVRLGLYNLYVEPLDGAFPPSTLSGGIWNPGNFDTTFRTTVMGGSSSPTVFPVRLGSTRDVGTITVGGPAPTINLTATGLTTSPNGFTSLAGASAPLTPPYTQSFVIAGPSVNTIPDSAFSFEGPFLSFTGPSSFSGVVGTLGFKIFPISVAPNTPPGGYTVRVETGGEIDFLTGAVDVQAPATPLPYAQAYLNSCMGSAGPVTLSATGTPNVGNLAFTLNATGTLGGQPGFLVLSLLPDIIPLFAGCDIAIDLNNLVFPFPGLMFVMSATTTSLIVPIPNNPGLAGLNVFAQFVASDPAAPPLGIGISNGLAIHIE